MVAFYIKNDTVVFQDGNTWIVFFNICRTFPFGFFCFLIPWFKLLLTIGMLNPEIPQSLFGNYSQAERLNKDSKSSQNGKLKFWRMVESISANVQGLPKCRAPLPCRLDKDIQLVSYSKAGYIFYSRHFGKPHVMQRLGSDDEDKNIFVKWSLKISHLLIIIMTFTIDFCW